MTTAIHHGPPGSYKSFAIVQDVVIPALKKGRTVITNIRGLDDINHIAKTMGFELPEESKLIAVKHDSREGFEHMARFFHWAPQGALIVMDEAQRVYPTRLKNLTEFDLTDPQEGELPRPTTVENAFDQHRHMNWDIYLSTTNVAKVHKEVRAVAEYAFRHRDMAGVLPWYKNKWREFKHDAENNGKSVSHYIGTPQLKTANTKVFECYQSTATGTTQGSNENKSIFADTKLRILLLLIFSCIAYFIYGLTQVMGRFDKKPEVPVETIAPPYAGNTDHDGSGNLHTASSENPADINPFPVIDIVGGRKVYYTGTFIVHNFELVSDSDTIHLTSTDFTAAGYDVEKISDCIVRITATKQQHIAVCSPEPLQVQSTQPTALLPQI
ncbi:zonular occludens toxin family protein [Bacterioplanoides sp.]|uniref:zonular occludens toxin family protein n=1 Tax=Bacterioplanoides sp. TaxID=2066072 RepID=UPI003B5AEE27